MLCLRRDPYTANFIVPTDQPEEDGEPCDHQKTYRRFQKDVRVCLSNASLSVTQLPVPRRSCTTSSKLQYSEMVAPSDIFRICGHHAVENITYNGYPRSYEPQDAKAHLLPTSAEHSESLLLLLSLEMTHDTYHGKLLPHLKCSQSALCSSLNTRTNPHRSY